MHHCSVNQAFGIDVLQSDQQRYRMIVTSCEIKVTCELADMHMPKQRSADT